MKNRSGEKIKLASIDELLGVVNEESAMEIEMNFRWKHRTLSLTGYSGIFIRHRKSIRILPVMI